MSLRKACLVFCVVLLIPFSFAGAMEQQYPIKKTIKMGMELELQGITYINSKNVTILDHIRLFESEKKDEKESSKTKGQPNWYLEVDGSGNLEFVSRPFDLEEKLVLEQSLKEMHYLLWFIISKSIDEYGETKKSGYSFFRIVKNTKINGVGTWILKAPKENLLDEEVETLENIDIIEIELKDLTCRVRPQVTFELPLSLIPRFSSYMAQGHTKLTEIIKSIKITKNDDLNGLLYLIKLYILFLDDTKEYKELGPKEKITLMSRKSFSSMYNSLEGTEKNSFPQLVSIFFTPVDLNKKLFATNYPLYFDGNDLGQTAFKNDIETVTRNVWLQSVITPSVGFDSRQEHKKKWKQLIENKFSSAAKIIRRQIEKNLFDKKTDILSSPPFLPSTYSMGKYEDNDKTAIIEMRGYSHIYGSEMRMGPIVLQWFHREYKNAYIEWDPTLLLDIGKYKAIYNEISENMQKTDWYQDEVFASIHVNLFERKGLRNFKELEKESHSVLFVESLKGFNDLLKDLHNKIDKNLKEPIMKTYSLKKEWVLSMLKSGGVLND